jgi:hypothetical protein
MDHLGHALSPKVAQHRPGGEAARTARQLRRELGGILDQGVAQRQLAAIDIARRWAAASRTMAKPLS